MVVHPFFQLNSNSYLILTSWHGLYILKCMHILMECTTDSWQADKITERNHENVWYYNAYNRFWVI